MKTIILTIFGVLCCINFGESATSFLPNAKDPAHPGKCVDKYDNIMLDIGQTITDRETCVEISCQSNYQMNYYSCGSIGGPDNCHLSKIDQTKDYPDCCPKLVCPED